MEETTGTLVQDFSGMGNNGTWNGNVTVNSTTGIYKNGLLLDYVNDYIDVGNKTSLNPTTAVSVGAWIFPNNRTVTMKIIDNYDGFDGFQLYLEANGFYSFRATNGDVGTLVQVQKDITYFNSWHYFVGIFNGSHTLLYIDGIQSGSQAAGISTIGVTSQNTTIGKTAQSATNFFNGTIDEVRIWNRSLSANEIQSHYNITLRQ